MILNWIFFYVVQSSIFMVPDIGFYIFFPLCFLVLWDVEKELLISKNGFIFSGIEIEIKIFLDSSFLILGRVFAVFIFLP